MEGFKTYSGYKVGASHILKNMGCEDYAATYDDENVCIAVISDGHGDKKCFRSARGAHIACDVSIVCVRKLFDSSPNSFETIKKSPDRILTELEREIIREWNKSVNDDLSSSPIMEDELNGLSEDVIKATHSGFGLNKVYGCTLIMCVVIDGFWFGIHIGDGKCVAVMNNGLYTQPIPWDEVGCVGNRSTSICNSNSFAGFRYVYGTDIPTGLFVASDGIDESFDESGLYRCYYTLGYWVQTLPKEDLDLKMDELLSQVTNNGSGDDVSIACILSTKNSIKKPYASSEQVAGKLKELINGVKDKEDLFESLTKSKKETAEELLKIKNEIEELKKKIALQEQQIKEKEQELTNIDNSIHDVAMQLQKDVKQLPKAKETKKRIDQYWKENGVEIKENTDLDYLPRYSEKQLENVIVASEELLKAEQLTESSDNEIKTTVEDNNITGQEKHDGKSVNDKSYTGAARAEQEDRIDTRNTVIPLTERFKEADSENHRQMEYEKSQSEPDSKRQTNGFFGGLFGGRK